MVGWGGVGWGWVGRDTRGGEGWVGIYYVLDRVMQRLGHYGGIIKHTPQSSTSY